MAVPGTLMPARVLARAVPLRVVSLDLDGTLIHPAIFNAVADALGFGEPLARTYEAYVRGEMTIPEAFALDYRHFVGRRVTDMRRVLATTDRWTPGIAGAIARFHRAGVRVVLTTDQPRFLAEHVRAFGVDDVVCSEAVIADGVVTADVSPAFEKWPNLERWLARHGVDARDVAHVGNGTNDIPVFTRVGDSVAVNYERDAVAAAARRSIRRLRDLGEVAEALGVPAWLQ